MPGGVNSRNGDVGKHTVHGLMGRRPIDLAIGLEVYEVVQDDG